MTSPSLGLRLRRKRRRLMFLAIRLLGRAAGFRRARLWGRLIGELQFRLGWRTAARCAGDMAQVLGRPAGDPVVKAQLRSAYHLNTAAVLEVLAMFDRHQDERMLAAHCEVQGLEHVQAALAGGRGAILLGTHSGNGLLLAVRLAGSGLPVSVVYRQSRMMSEDLFEHGLALYGIEPICANAGIKAYGRMLGALRQNRVVFLMLDQGVKAAQDGVLVRFLGKDMPMPAGPAQLARHSRAPVLPVATAAADPVWRFDIEPPVLRVTGASLESDLETLLRVSERQVLRYPQLWSWHHRRWRKFPVAPGLQSQPGEESQKS
ncbi:MAG: lysophospholipid acyltransferase family protein [Panacagrimonas sp.]